MITEKKGLVNTGIKLNQHPYWSELLNFGDVPGLEIPVSRLVQGTVPVSSKRLEESFSLLDSVIAAGGNAFDTAHVYGSGDNERVFGQWLKDRGIRHRVVIVAKGAHHNQDRNRVTPFDIASDLHDSLARMHVDYVDLYLLHRDDPAVPVGPIVQAMHRHIREGKVRAWGGSNWSHERIQKAIAYASEHDLTPPAVTSPQFSLAEQVKEPWPGCITITGYLGTKARKYYSDTGTPVFAWSSLAGGFFSGRIRRDSLDFEDYYLKLAVECYATESNFERLQRAEQLANEKGCSMTQIAMAYVINSPLNVFPLVGCQTGEEFTMLAEALTIGLTPAEMGYLDLRR